MTDPTTTSQLFQHDRVAEGYASARPYLHPRVMSRVRDAIGTATFRRGLDVGCGTGMSSAALRPLARRVVGVDASTEMLRRARSEPGVSYAAAPAEALPFRDCSFDLILACGSMDWVNREIFMPRAWDLLENGGWLVSLDFGDTGSSPDVPGLQYWYEESFQGAFPRPPAADPMITAEEAAANGFDAPIELDFSTLCPVTADQYARFLLTESNVVAAVEYGNQTETKVLGWLNAGLEPLFGGSARRIVFAGYIQALRRH